MKIELGYFLKLVLPIFFLASVGWVFITDIYLVLLSFFVFYFLIYLIGCNTYHRYWSHKQFKMNRIIEKITVIFGLFSMVGDPINYAKTHRWHHAKADTDEDPHSPIHGRFHAFIGWMFKKRKDIPPFIVRDLINYNNRYLFWVASNQIFIVWITLILLYIISLNLFYGLVLSMIVAFIFEMLVNAIAHDPVKRLAINRKLIAYVTMSSYHKFHHDNPGRLHKGDPGRFIVWILKI